MANNFNDSNPNNATFAPTITPPANPRVQPNNGQQTVQTDNGAGPVMLDTAVAATRIKASGLPIVVPANLAAQG